MYALKIGWKTFLFTSATEAAKVIDALEKATPVDTLYNGTDHKVMYYLTEPNISLERLGAIDVYPDHDSLQAYIDERLKVLQQRERDQEALDRQVKPTADSFDGQ